jgi:hypothetical protein
MQPFVQLLHCTVGNLCLEHVDLFKAVRRDSTPAGIHFKKKKKRDNK